MKHTSIRLSDSHAEKIAQTGQSPTTIIKKALDLYFKIPPENLEPAKMLIEEHIRLYHRAQPAHTISTNKHVVPQVEHAARAQIEHILSTEAQSEHKLSTSPPMECKKEGEVILCTPSMTAEARQALTYILGELEAGREPTSREAADKVGLTPTGLGMALSKHGIKAQNTRRDMKSVKIYTKVMIPKIKELLTA
ncbi:MAG TPA: hypothetical protein PLA21_07330 [Rectinema sp.]|nr:hypothetical protein [Rectinema sp.]